MQADPKTARFKLRGMRGKYTARRMRDFLSSLIMLLKWCDGQYEFGQILIAVRIIKQNFAAGELW
jgi:hypothetical protein